MKLPCQNNPSNLAANSVRFGIRKIEGKNEFSPRQRLPIRRPFPFDSLAMAPEKLLERLPDADRGRRAHPSAERVECRLRLKGSSAAFPASSEVLRNQSSGTSRSRVQHSGSICSTQAPTALLSFQGLAAYPAGRASATPTKSITSPNQQGEGVGVAGRHSKPLVRHRALEQHRLLRARNRHRIAPPNSGNGPQCLLGSPSGKDADPATVGEPLHRHPARSRHPATARNVTASKTRSFGIAPTRPAQTSALVPASQPPLAERPPSPATRPTSP